MRRPEMPVIPDDRGDDLHNLEWAADCDLALFPAGNQFMAMPELLAAFRRRHPQVRRVFWESLPPGLELRQILAGGARYRGRVLRVRPDVYTSVSRRAMETLAAAGRIGHGRYRPYLHNRLTLMVPAGNPAGIAAVSDLGAERVRISQPDPANEDIAGHTIAMYRAAGGEGLVRRIMHEKRSAGTTRMTIVHHRETPRRIAAGTVDAGPVWATEAKFARRSGMDFEVVEPGPALDQRERIVYYACRLADAPHPENAAAFLDFLTSPAAREIFSRHGFTVPGD